MVSGPGGSGWDIGEVPAESPGLFFEDRLAVALQAPRLPCQLLRAGTDEDSLQ